MTSPEDKTCNECGEKALYIDRGWDDYGDDNECWMTEDSFGAKNISVES